MYRIVKTHVNLHAKADAETTVMAVVQQHAKDRAQAHAKMVVTAFANLRACLLAITIAQDAQDVIMLVKKGVIHSAPELVRLIVMGLVM